MRSALYRVADLPIALLLVATIALAMLAGCDEPQPARPIATAVETERIEPAAVELSPPAAEPPRQSAGPDLPTSPPEEPEMEGPVVEETWDAFFMQGQRVGYSHTRIAHVEQDGRRLVQTRNTTRTTLKRSGQSIVQDMSLTSLDTHDGELVRCDSRMTTGPGEIASRGSVDGPNLTIETTTLGKSESRTIRWAGGGGFFAAEQSLRRQPLKPSEQRTVSGLMPVFNLAGTTKMTAQDYETVTLAGGDDARLLRVSSVIDLGGQQLETVLWMSADGAVLKSLVPSIGQEAVRTTKEDALQAPADGQFDLLVASVVKLAEPLHGALGTQRVVYRAKVKTGRLEGVFAESLSQRVKPIDDRTAEVTVLAVRPDVPTTLDVKSTPPTDDDLAANNLIQSDDPLIVQMAAKVGAQSGTPWETALALEKYVAASIQKKNFSQAFATAGEVARSLEGDCTEHAVLLAALCRARKIPARGVFGLVYYPPEQGFAYHMWNEVWIGDRWVPLDGTLGRGGVGADRLKLADSNLSGTTGLAAMLPVIQVFGRLELEVLSAE